MGRWWHHLEREDPGRGTGTGKDDQYHFGHRAFEECLLYHAYLLVVIIILICVIIQRFSPLLGSLRMGTLFLIAQQCNSVSSTLTGTWHMPNKYEFDE